MFWVLKTYVKTDRQENIYNFTLKNFVYLNLWIGFILSIVILWKKQIKFHFGCNLQITLGVMVLFQLKYMASSRENLSLGIPTE